MSLECLVMQCPECGSTHICKNGIKQGKQNHICVVRLRRGEALCRRQFMDTYDTPRTYLEDIKQHCLTLYVNGEDVIETYLEAWQEEGTSIPAPKTRQVA